MNKKEKDKKEKEKEELLEYAKNQADEQENKEMDIENFDTDDIFSNKEENEAKMEGENLSEIIKAWLDDRYVHAKTRLNANQIVALTILKTLAEKYNVKCIKELITNFVRYKLSEGGQSSKELVDILKSRTEIEGDDSIADAIKPFLK